MTTFRYGRAAVQVAAISMGLALGLVLLCAPEALAKGPGSSGSLRVLSNRADLVSGGDALVEVALRGGPVPAPRLRVSVGGRNVTRAFQRQDKRRFVGLLEGLAVGTNVVTARIGRTVGARLTITNHPAGGPVFTGPQVQPWFCTTEANGLGAPVDPQCDAARPVVTYKYKDATTGMLVDYDPAHPPPADSVAVTTTDQGNRIPFIVRLERGTLDRSIYSIAVLDDPARPGSLGAWNHKLFVPFGGSCSAKHSQTAPGNIEVSQSAPDDAVLLDLPLSRGFAVATSGLNVLGQDCNPTVSAEALMMLKEHMIADAYPGLLDGLIPSCSFPDLWSPIEEVADCSLVEHYFDQVSPQLWPDPAARRAVTGSQTGATCAEWIATFKDVLNPSNNDLPPSACDVPEADIYNAQTNRQGVRCTAQDYAVADWGRRAGDGFANRPLDNVGVQYGLKSLQSGAILPEQFVDLNEKIGGLDIDGNYSPKRMQADPGAMATAYRSDLVVTGRQLSRVPIIDIRGTGNPEIHTDFWSYATRERLRNANGTSANQVIWSSLDSDFALVGRLHTVSDQAFLTMDRWLTNIEADHSHEPLARKVVADKPAAAADACFTGSQKITDEATCRSLYPYYGNPRTSAGGPLASDVLKCRLRPLDPDEYGVTFTPDQWARLRAAFPDGVCNFRLPAADRVSPLVWPSFSQGPGGRALGAPPTSKPIRRSARG